MGYTQLVQHPASDDERPMGAIIAQAGQLDHLSGDLLQAAGRTPRCRSAILNLG